MMKKKRLSASLPPAPALKFGSKFSILVFVLLFLGFIRLNFQTNLRSHFSIYQASRLFIHEHDAAIPDKIAFLFLTRQNLPLDFVWANFFKDIDTEMFSIYVHSEPGFVFNQSNTKSSFFYDRQLNNSIKVKWGEASMIEAERLLLETALHDPKNQRFVLLSDSCMPLYNFGYIYNYLMSSPKSFVDSFVDFRSNSYRPKMYPIIPKQKWRKGSQWFVLTRRHAVIVVQDDILFPVFQKLCKTSYNCLPDEHYVQTLLKIGGHENEIEPRALTYTLWNQNARGRKMSSSHPYSFLYPDATPQLIQEIKGINNFSHEYNDGIVLCNAPCFIFARKFTPWAAARLLAERSVDLWEAQKLLHFTYSTF